MRDTSIYKDINQFRPDERPYATDAQAIYQSVLNLVRTAFNDIPFSRMGINLDDELFELYDADDTSTLLVQLSGRIEDADNRIKLDTRQSEISIKPNNRLSIALIFEIEGIGDQKFEIQETLQL